MVLTVLLVIGSVLAKDNSRAVKPPMGMLFL